MSIRYKMDATTVQVEESKMSVPNIVMLVDSSGSMYSIKDDIIGSVKGFLDNQKELADDTELTLIKFDMDPTVIYSKVQLANATPLDNHNYVPSGSTSLYDAIGEAIHLHEGDDKVLMVIVTDGEENTSKKFTKHSITRLIEEKKEEGWNFIFLANNLDTSRGGTDIGITRSDEGCYSSGSNNVVVGTGGLSSVLRGAVSVAATVFRTTSCVPNLNEFSIAHVESPVTLKK
jgi:hypothetical protein